MNKAKNILISLLSVFTAMTLAGCEIIPNESLSESESVDDGEIIGYEIRPTNEYMVGGAINYTDDYSLVFVYESGREDVISGLTATTVRYVKDPSGDYYTLNSTLTYSGTYNGTVRLRYDGTTYYDEDVDFTVNTALGGDYTLRSITAYNKSTYFEGEYLSDVLDVELHLGWDVLTNEVSSYQDIKDYLTVELYSSLSPSENVIESPLEASTTYTVKISYGDVSDSFSFKTSKGVVKVDSSDLTITASDLNGGSYAPSTGEVKVLVIPITLSLSDEAALTYSYVDEWTDTKLETLEDNFFSTSVTDTSFKNYYETASYGQMEVSGMVAEPYVETDSELTADAIMNSGSFRKVLQVIANAVTYIEEHNKNINWSDYDLNDDGCIDNVHLVTNFNTSKYSSQTGNEVWSTPLWPHMWQTGNVGTLDNPTANVYSISAIDHISDAITAIHEQGHIFGLDDYYDYAYSGVDYIGYADMQSANMFDWNSFSKLTQGWVSPYVVTGEEDSVTISISPSSSSGDLIIIPADYSTWNGSAYDEYYLIELFTPTENNTLFWSNYSTNYYDLGEGGIRMYHVDARLYDGSSETDDPSNASWGCNNTYTWEDSNGGNYDWQDYILLALLQAGGNNTFGATRGRSYLNESDLFQTGDVFTFSEYSSFLTKSHAEVTTMDNGETFPYTITFDYVSKYSATITISK